MRKDSVEIKTANTGRDRIGISLENGVQIVVPSYYLDVDKKKVADLSSDEKNKIKRMILAWKKYQKHCKDLNYGIDEGFSSFYDYDLALDIVQDFIENGLYIEYESKEVVRRCGKIEFSHTIKHSKPLLTDEGPVYLEYYTKVKKTVDQNLLNNLQIQILNEISETIGWMIGYNAHLELTARPLQFNRATISQLIQLRNTSFNSRKLQLINYFIRYIEQNTSTNAEKNDLTVVTAYHFWEAMVSDVIGNVSHNRLKKIFYVRHSYHNKKTGIFEYRDKPLKPDSVLESSDKVTILDAKYYTNGNLPGNYDVTKQFAYMDKAVGYFEKNDEKRTYRNIMILPTSENSFLSEIQIFFDENVEPVGSKVPIELLYINFNEMLDAYLAGIKINIEGIE